MSTTPTLRYSASSEACYRRCQRLWWWQYVERWRPVTPSDALQFGSAWHRLREGKDARLEDPYQHAALTALQMGYLQHYADDDLDVIRREVWFKLELIPGMPLVGKVDGIVRDGKRLLLLEHKTSGSDILPESDYWQRLSMDAQLSTYWLGARALGVEPDGIIYDVARKTTLRPLKATPPEKQKRKKDGTLYANQREVDETPAEYRARVLDAIHAAPERHYQRREVVRTQRQLKEHWHTMQTYAQQMLSRERLDDCPSNPSACHQYGECEFLRCCLSSQQPDDFPTDLHQPAKRKETVNDGQPF